MIFLLDVVVAWALYIVFRNTNRDLSLLAAWFRIVYTVFLGVAIVFFFQALQLLEGVGFPPSVPTEELNAQALVALEAFNSTWLIGLAALGMHLVFLGCIVNTSRCAPLALGGFLIAGGLAYLVDSGANILLANYNDHQTLFAMIVIAPAVIAEGWFGLWLLLRGGKNRNSHRGVFVTRPIDLSREG